MILLSFYMTNFQPMQVIINEQFFLSLDLTRERISLFHRRVICSRTYNHFAYHFGLPISYFMFHTPTHTALFLSTPLVWMRHPDLEISLRNASKNIFLGNMTHSNVLASLVSKADAQIPMLSVAYTFLYNISWFIYKCVMPCLGNTASLFGFTLVRITQTYKCLVYFSSLHGFLL